MAELFSWFVLLMPLAAAVTISLFLKERAELSARISIAAIVIPFWLSCLMLLDPDPIKHSIEIGFNWLSVDNFQVDFGFRLDRLTVLMLLVVTGVGGAIHIYSYDYMKGDSGFSRFFATLSFFTFSMLGLVLANNFLMMFIFWELVGVSSYLLIGFWFERPSAADAGKKAFLVNRIGDAGFLAGIILLWTQFGTLNFSSIQSKLAADPNALGTLSTIILLLIFCGVLGKSAQFPLHVWLPDAMEGPTPVSALIHAATMVAAGIFLLCRIFFLFDATPAWPSYLSWLHNLTALDIITWIGIITALLAGLMAIQQNDIKRILAYSTLSQLGFMVMAVGLSGPTPAMYHLTTHAAFKALLFLGAGSVIHALHHEQDIWKMGSLRTSMPVTFWSFILATLALCGAPPLSGFFSKDAILAQALHSNKYIFVLALFCSLLTSFYMFRLVFVVFFGKSRSAVCSHAHESPRIMTQPMLFLTLPTLFLGFWGVEAFLQNHFDPKSHHVVIAWYDQIFAPFTHAPLAAFLGLGAFLAGCFGAMELYRGASVDPLPQFWPFMCRAMKERFWFDELYERIIIRPLDFLAWFIAGFDRWFVGTACVGSVRETTRFTGMILRFVQTGNMQTYAFLFAAGVLVLLYCTCWR